jgi:hypothetical protein
VAVYEAVHNGMGHFKNSSLPKTTSSTRGPIQLEQKLDCKRYFGIIATRENRNGALVKLSSEFVVRQKNLGITKPSELETEGPAGSSETAYHNSAKSRARWSKPSSECPVASSKRSVP